VTLDEWNERYRSGEEIQSEPAELLVDAASALPAGRALDLACGAGRNALWLASRGWEVVAIDGASEAIRLVREQDAAIDARVLDLEAIDRLPFEDASFDLVAILYYLHRPLFAEAKRIVRPGGTVVCAVRMRGTYRVAPGELARAFEDCEIVRCTEGEIAEIVARR
jgi:SAM-dependent methyltransferase